MPTLHDNDITVT